MTVRYDDTKNSHEEHEDHDGCSGCFVDVVNFVAGNFVDFVA